MGRPKGSKNKNQPISLQCRTCSQFFVPNYYQRYNVKKRNSGFYCTKQCFLERTISLETLEKQSKSHIGKVHSTEHRRKISLGLKGIKKTKEHIEKARLAKLAFHDKVGRKIDLRKLLRNRKEYKDWRSSVYIRDNYTCQECGERGKELNADHVKPWSLFPDLRFDIDNGRTLCVSCHKKTDTYGSKVRNYNFQTA